MIDDIDDIIGGGISRKGIENALKKFKYDFNKTVNHLLDRKDQKTKAEADKPEPKPQPKKTAEKDKPSHSVSNNTVSKSKAPTKEMEEPLIVERKSSRKMSKEMILEKPLDRSTWNKLYPIIDYSR